MPKERNFNPAQAQHKADKARTLKKSRAQLATQRAEKLARRNPDRLQRQIDALTAERDASGGQLRPRDRQQLEQLERDVAAIRKAREKTGTSSGGPGDGGRGTAGAAGERGGVLGKRRREYNGNGSGDGADGGRRRHQRRDHSVGSDVSDATDPEVRDIPMPRDTPPPIPRQAQRGNHAAGQRTEGAAKAQQQQEPPPPPQTTYEAAPQLRDLRKEATAFVPAAVARQLKAVRAGPGGRLLEEEEVQRLEKAGYVASGARRKDEDANIIDNDNTGSKEDDQTQGGDTDMDLDREEARWRQEMEAEAEVTAAQRGALKESAMRDGAEAVQAAVEEAQFHMLDDEAVTSGDAPSRGLGAEDAASSAEKQLRRVEIEEVEDEDA